MTGSVFCLTVELPGLRVRDVDAGRDRPDEQIRSARIERGREREGDDDQGVDVVEVDHPLRRGGRRLEQIALRAPEVAVVVPFEVVGPRARQTGRPGDCTPGERDVEPPIRDFPEVVGRAAQHAVGIRSGRDDLVGPGCADVGRRRPGGRKPAARCVDEHDSHPPDAGRRHDVDVLHAGGAATPGTAGDPRLGFADEGERRTVVVIRPFRRDVEGNLGERVPCHGVRDDEGEGSGARTCEQHDVRVGVVPGGVLRRRDRPGLGAFADEELEVVGGEPARQAVEHPTVAAGEHRIGRHVDHHGRHAKPG